MNDPFFSDSRGGAAKKRKPTSALAKKGPEKVRSQCLDTGVTFRGKVAQKMLFTRVLPTLTSRTSIPHAGHHWLTHRASDRHVSDVEEEETAADKRLRLAKEVISKAEAYGV